MLNIRSWLHHLRILTPPNGAIVVGAGLGSRIGLLTELQIPSAYFVEADERQFMYLKARLPVKKNWEAIHALIGEGEGEVDYYHASSPAENGLLSPECLTGIWPNIKEKTKEKLVVHTLEDLIKEINNTVRPNWLVVECLPALPILRSLGGNLQEIDVLLVRVVLDRQDSNQTYQLIQEIDVNPTDLTFSHRKEPEHYSTERHDVNVKNIRESTEQLHEFGVTLQQVKAWLSERDYRLLVCEEEKNPRIVNALFVRGQTKFPHELNNEKSMRIFRLNQAEQAKDANRTQVDTLEKKILSQDQVRSNVISKMLPVLKNRTKMSDALPPEIFMLPNGYKSRREYHHYDDIGAEDKWQYEVYMNALGLAIKNKFKKIVDIGCGSGYKLVTYFEGYETVGYELKENVERLMEKYPDRVWKTIDLDEGAGIVSDIIICADVIEHLINPLVLLDYLSRCQFKYLIISTPDRDMLHAPNTIRWYGPPGNVAHTMEWNQAEMAELIGHYFTIVEHKITNMAQHTQYLLCSQK